MSEVTQTSGLLPPEPLSLLPETISAFEIPISQVRAALQLDRLVGGESNPRRDEAIRLLAEAFAFYAEDISAYLGVKTPGFALADKESEREGTNMQVFVSREVEKGKRSVVEVSSVFIRRMAAMMMSAHIGQRITANLIIGSALAHEEVHNYMERYFPTSDLMQAEQFLKGEVEKRGEVWSKSKEYYASPLEIKCDQWALDYLRSRRPTDGEAQFLQVWDNFIRQEEENLNSRIAQAEKMGILKKEKTKAA